MALNQLQELYQKKYFDKALEYTFEPWNGDEWNCECVCGGVNGFGRGVGKTKAKKESGIYGAGTAAEGGGNLRGELGEEDVGGICSAIVTMECS